MTTSSKSDIEQWLRETLDPLQGITHHVAAREGWKILQKYISLIERVQSHLERDYLQEIDNARGHIALHLGATETEQLLSELRDESAAIRLRAAHALRPIVFGQPDRVQVALCAAIRLEEDANVLCQLLWICYRLIELVPDALLDALEASAAIRWEEAPKATGLALVMLGDLAHHSPKRVFDLLPRQLDTYDPGARALLHELLIFAWWSLAEHLPAARPHLMTLAEPILDDIPNQFRPFALRGAAIAQLALMCAGTIPVRELAGRQISYLHWRLQFLYIYTDTFVQRHATVLVAHPQYEQLQQRLLECLHQEATHEASPLERELGDNQYRCAQLCLDMLIDLAIVQSVTPLAMLQALPSGWQALHAAGRLVQAGRIEPEIITFARDTCAAYAQGGTMQVLGEREFCLAQLARLADDPHSALEAHRTDLGTPFFQPRGRALGLAELTDTFVERTLSLLAESIRTKDDLPTLYHWAEEARTWRSLLLARLYARMFDARPVQPVEARELCEQVLTAVRALPADSDQQEYEMVYEEILSWLEGQFRPLPSLIVPQIQNALKLSHSAALILLQRAREAFNREEEPNWIADAIVDRRGWWESTKYQYKGGSFSTGGGFGIYSIYVFPAVRLALIAIGRRYGLSDPAAQFMRQRLQAIEAVTNYRWALQDASTTDYRHREQAVGVFQRQVAHTPRDERIWGWLGQLLLVLGRFTEAEQALAQCLSLPWCDTNTRAGALYNLACVYARLGQEDKCRDTLLEAAQIRPLDCNWLSQDPDLESVREKPWFKALC